MTTIDPRPRPFTPDHSDIRPDPADAAPAEPPRPFGAHLRMAWWKPPVIIIGTLVALGVANVGLGLVAIMLDVVLFGRDPLSMEISPLLLLATNLSLVAMAPVAILLTAWLSGTPWRRLLSVDEGLRWRRLGGYLLAFTALLVFAAAASFVLAPEVLGLRGFALTGTTLGMLAVMLLTTPLQAAAEELAYRGAIMPAIASWFPSARLAIVAGLLGSSLLFGASHLSLDPWLMSYYTLIGICLGSMVLLSRGLEAAIAFHVANNVLLMALSALFADGGGLVIDRSVGMGGPFMLIFMAVDVLAVGLVLRHERRARRAQGLTARSA